MDAVSITGLQGTGKTTLARALGRALDAVVFSRDPLMDVLLAGGVPLESSPGTQGIGELGHELHSALLRTQLQMGRSVVLECVVGRPMREHWKNIAVQESARFWIIDTICCEEDLHRERFEVAVPRNGVIGSSTGRPLLGIGARSCRTPARTSLPTPPTRWITTSERLSN